MVRVAVTAPAAVTIAAAPHAARVRELVRAHLPALPARLRADAIEALVRRVVELERSPVVLDEATPTGAIAVIALRVQQVLRQLAVEERALTRSFAAFSQIFAQHEDEAERRHLLAEYLRETVADARRLRGDLRALDRHLGADALRERHNRELLDRSAEVELCFTWLAGAVAAMKDDDDARARLRDARLAETCGAELVAGRRWQGRLAAGRALIAIAEVGDAGAAQGDARKAATTRDDHPWVQAAGLEVIAISDAAQGHALIAERVFTPAGDRDLFVRKLALRIARRRLPAPAARDLIARAVAARDPSEHVRMGLVELAAELGWSHGGAHLAILAGPDERSPKVRGAAAIALRTLAAASAAA